MIGDIEWDGFATRETRNLATCKSTRAGRSAGLREIGGWPAVSISLAECRRRKKASLTGTRNPLLYRFPMLKTILLATVIAVTSIVSSQAHCGSCDHKDDKKKTDKKDGEKKELVTKVQP